MKVKLGDGLWLANILSWLLILFILVLPDNPVRIVLGIPFVLFFPGYALITALVPRKTGMSGIERLALSFGLSIALVILIGLGLNYTPFGIRLTPIMFSLAAVLLVLSAVAWWRERRVSLEERFSISFHIAPGAVWSGRPLDKALSIILVLAIVASLGAVVYTIAKPKPGEAFTEFYILGPEGKAADYPSEVKAGEKATVTGCIVSHLREPVSYTIEVSITGTEKTEIGPFTLQPGEKWEGEVGFTLPTVGPNQKVEFILHESPQIDSDPKSLHIWVDVVS